MAHLFDRGKGPTPKFYLYVSATKLDILLPQVPPSFVESFQADFKVNVGIVSAAVKSVPEDRAELAVRVGLLTRYLEDVEQIGSIMLPERYVKSTASLQMGVVHEYASDLAFFGGIVDGVKVGLIGSSASMVGGVPRSDANRGVYYYTLKFLNRLADTETAAADQPPYMSYSEAIDIALSAIPSIPHRVEFLARTLYSKANVLVATPIYVALMD